MTIIIGNGTVLSGGERPTVLSDGGVAWFNDRIQAVDRMVALRAGYPGAELLDARGGLILPGFVNLHHHFYSALARGLDPGVRPRNFGELLEGLWWRLDRSLDEEAVRISARLTLADCIRCGCTTVFDHHASPRFISGSLEAIAGEVEAAGLAAVLCYESTDRNGHDGAMAGVEENADFCGRHLAHRMPERDRGADALRRQRADHAHLHREEQRLRDVSDAVPYWKSYQDYFLVWQDGTWKVEAIF